MNVLNDAHRRRRGQGMVEYGLLVGLIGILVVAVMLVLTPNVRDLYLKSPSQEDLGEAQYAISEAIQQ